MKSKLKILALGIMTFALSACGSSGGGGGGGGEPQPSLSIFEVTTGSPIHTPIPQVGGRISLTGISWSEFHFNKGKALVVISSGLKGESQGLPSGGLGVVDIGTLKLETVIPLESTLTGHDSRIVHTYMDPEGKYLWANNDGPLGDRGQGGANCRLPEPPPVCADDTVFRINVDPEDSGYLTDITEILIGDGHHKSAFSRPSSHQPDARRFFGTHNLSASSINLIGDDPDDSNTYLKVVKTVKSVGFVPHGMDYSPVSGHLYTGLTGGGVVILDTTHDDIVNKPVFDCAGNNDCNNPSLDASVSKIPKSEIPFSGYIHANHDGSVIYTTGFDTANDIGYLSAIDAANNDQVIDVISIPGVHSSSFDTNDDRLYVPATNRGSITDKIVVFDINPASADYHKELMRIGVGEPNDHRNGEISEDGRIAVYPDSCDHCQNLHVIDTESVSDIPDATLTVDGVSPRVSIVKTKSASGSDPEEKYLIIAGDAVKEKEDEHD